MWIGTMKGPGGIGSPVLCFLYPILKEASPIEEDFCVFFPWEMNSNLRHAQLSTVPVCNSESQG